MPEQPRIPALADGEWSDEVREMLERTDRRGRVFNIFRTLAHHPKLLKRWMVFANHLLFKSSLEARDREILILRSAWLSASEYEWGQHVRLGREVGLSDEELKGIAAGGSDAMSEADGLLLRAADRLHDKQRLDEETWNALSDRYSTEQIFDLIFTVGGYTMLAGALNSVGVERDPGVLGFEDLPGYRP